MTYNAALVSTDSHGWDQGYKLPVESTIPDDNDLPFPTRPVIRHFGVPRQPIISFRTTRRRDVDMTFVDVDAGFCWVGVVPPQAFSTSIYAESAEIDNLAASNAPKDFADKVARVKERLDYLVNLPEGWEDDDGQPGRSDHLKGALAFLNRLPPGPNVPSAMICNEGTLGFIWQLPWLHAEIEFIDEHRFWMYSREWDGERKEVRLPEVDVRNLSTDWFRQTLPRIFETRKAIVAQA